MKTVLILLLSTFICTATLQAQTGWFVLATTTDNLSTVCFVDSLKGWIGGTSSGVGMIRRTTDGGLTWTSQPLPVTNNIQKITFLNSTTGFAAGGNGTVLKTTDGGQSWIKKNSGSSIDMFSIFFLNEKLGWACGLSTVLITTDGGETWSSRLVTGAVAHWDIAFTNAQNGLVVGLYGGCFKTVDGGSTWIPFTQPLGGSSYFRVQYLSPTRIIIAGGAQIALSKDGGQTWTSPYNAGQEQMNGVCFGDSLNGWAVSQGTISRSTDGGSHWTRESIPGYRYLTSITTPDGVHAWAIGDGTILKTTEWLIPTSTVTNIDNTPTRFSLGQNYPNPFNPSTTISFSLPLRSFVTLKVFDVMGREIATIVSEETPAGNHSRQWNASGVSSGMYFYRIQAGDFMQTKKLLLVR
jgi:photosystem II stability/assembly factor-like uncharacterized protein